MSNIRKVKRDILSTVMWLDTDTSIKTDLSRNKQLVAYWKHAWKMALNNAKTDYERAEITLYLDALTFKVMHMVTWQEMSKLVCSICIK